MFVQPRHNPRHAFAHFCFDAWAESRVAAAAFVRLRGLPGPSLTGHPRTQLYVQDERSDNDFLRWAVALLGSSIVNLARHEWWRPGGCRDRFRREGPILARCTKGRPPNPLPKSIKPPAGPLVKKFPRVQPGRQAGCSQARVITDGSRIANLWCQSKPCFVEAHIQRWGASCKTSFDGLPRRTRPR